MSSLHRGRRYFGALGFAAALWAVGSLPSARAQIYVADGNLNGGSGGVAVFAPSASGNVLPDMTLVGANTTITSMKGAVANSTNVFVLCNNFVDPPFVKKFSLPTSGNIAPVSTTYLAPKTGSYNAPTALAIDGTNLYVLDNGSGVGGANGAVSVYPLSSLTSNSSGSPLAATRTIGGATNTGFNRPNGLAVDSTSIYVANNVGNNLLIFALAASGDVAPTATITGLNSPSGVAVDSTTIYVLNSGNSRVTTYPVGTAGGAVAATTTLGSTSLTTGAFYVGVDATNVYVGDTGDALGTPVPTVLVFPKTTNNTSATPSATIAGTTALTAINSLFVLAPPGTAAPTVTASSGSTTFTGGGSPVAVDSGVAITAVPSTLATATIQITSGYLSAEDALAFTNSNATTYGNISGVFNVTLGILRLESVGATATKAQWQAALQAMTYSNTSGSPTIGNRTVTFKVFDGAQTSSTASKTVAVAAAPTVPGAPTIGTATAGNAQATVTFSAPASNGGSAITGYTVTSSPAGGTDSNAGSTGLSHVVTGLTNGTAYTFTVTATNSVGTSAASSASNSVTPVTVPGAPTIGTATAGNAQATVTFTAPASNGGSAITGYTVTSSPAGGTDSNAGTTGTSHVVTGLTNGTAYTFTVKATNAVGTGAASSASNSITPATVPGAPTIGTATAGNAQATVTFTAPASNGGSAITGYTVTSSPAGGTDSNAGSTGMSHIVTGLTNGTAYTFTVTATNTVGTGAASAASNSVTPLAAPIVVSVTAPLAGTYAAGQALNFTVTFSSAVTVTTTGGTPSFAVTIGSVTRAATYVSGSGTTALTFRYTVALGDNASGGIVVASPIALNSGTINATSGGQAATLTFTPPTTTSVLVSTVPILTASSGSTAFTAGDNVASTPVAVDSGLTFTDPSLSALPTSGGALVTITGNYQAGTDALSFTNTGATTFGDITGTFLPDISFFGPAGTLILTSASGTPTIAQWQAALRAIKFTSTAVTPSTATRTISFKVNDGVQDSNTVTKTVTVTAVNQTPVVTTSNASSGFVVTLGAITIDSGITVTDRDNATLASATVSITSGFQTAEDVLAFTNNNSTTFGNIAGSYSVATGVLTLTSASATATVAQWQAALRAVTYNDTAASPNTSARTLSFVVNDGTTNSVAATKTVSVSSSFSTTTVATATSATYSSSDQTVTLSATVTRTGGTVTAGTVTFTVKSGSTTIGSAVTSAAITNGAATANFALPGGTAAGSYTIQAAYNGAALFSSSSDSTRALTVDSASTSVTASAPSVTFGSGAQAVTLTAKVTSDAGTVSGGTVTFTLKNSSGAAIGTAVTSGTVTNGTATAPYTLPAGTAIGSYTIQAVYNAAGSFASSPVSTNSLTVSPVATTTSASGEFKVKRKVTTFVSGVGNPAGLAFDASGDLYVANRNLSPPFIYKVTKRGTVSAFVTSELVYPNALAFDATGILYVIHSSRVISKVANNGAVSAFVTPPLAPGTVVSAYYAIAFDPAGNLYAARAADSTIYKVSRDGTGAPFVSSGLNNPTALAFDAAGNLYVANTGSDSISKVTPGGAVSTFVSSGLSRPSGLVFDASGNLYAANAGNDTVSKVTPDGTVSTFVASGLSMPMSLAFDPTGDFYVGNYGGTISKVTPVNFVTLTATVTSTAGTVNTGTVTFTLVDSTNKVIGTAVTSGTLSAGTTSVTYPIPGGASSPPYTIQAVYNSGGSFAASSDSSQKLTPTFAQSLQIFFGQFNTTANATSLADGLDRRARATPAPSSLAAILNPGGTTGKLVGYIASINAGFAVDIAIADDNTFTGQTKALTSSTGTGQTLTFSGSIANGVMTGSVAELGLSFIANVDPDAGSSAGSAGLYQASSLSAGGGTTYSIVGTQGQVFVLALTPSGVSAGLGTVSASGSYTVSTPQGASIAGTVNTTSGTTSATITSGGTTVSVSGVSAAVPVTHRLANLSILGSVGGGQTITAGFVVSGPKTVLARAIGPSLSQFGVPGVLATPTLTLFDGTGKPVVTNSGWAGDSALAAAFSQVGAFNLATTSRDAAATATLQAGAYTLQVTGGSTAGAALAELYDLDPIASPLTGNLINLSSLGPVAGNTTVLVSGFVIDGNSPRTVLIRGIGPSLTQFGVAGALATPLLKLYDGTQTVIAQNQAWGTPVTVSGGQTPANASAMLTAMLSAGAFPLATGSNDSGLVVRLPPGSYTVQLSGANNASGTALIEIYEIK